MLTPCCGVPAGARGVGDPQETLRLAQARIMALFQLLDSVLVALKENHGAVGESGEPEAPAHRRSCGLD